MWTYEDLAALAPVALSEHVAAVLDFLECGLDMTEVRTPPAAIEFACRLAEHGVPISELLRVYRLVHADLLHQFYAETAERRRAGQRVRPLLLEGGGREVDGDEVGDVPTWLAMSADHELALRALDLRSMLLVPLWARGSPLGLAQFVRRRTADPFDDDELLLAQEIASRAAVSIDNARRYTQERSTALTLQRSLLPHHVPEESAVETASRYLPSGSRAGVGGDWFDVMPLSGARVALVVGDVIGHGLHAAATMGRLRTAVRTLADIDLTPDELLTHLDDVVIRLQRKEEGGTDEISATCLYAVYDPVSRTCSMASAGHLPPAVVTPPTAGNNAPASRPVDFPELPIRPPLGLGGLPFETAQFELPPGSRLVLYTDGLVQSRSRDVASALALLRDVLSRTPESLEETCDELLSALLPSRPADDVALLVARTRALDADHVATWDLLCDPAVVSKARVHASDQLAAWGLEEMDWKVPSRAGPASPRGRWTNRASAAALEAGT